VGLATWRWGTTLGAFAWRGRRAAHGSARLAPLVRSCGARCSTGSARSAPDTLVAVLMALEIVLLEARRLGGRDRAWLLVPLAWVWANAHFRTTSSSSSAGLSRGRRVEALARAPAPRPAGSRSRW